MHQHSKKIFGRKTDSTVDHPPYSPGLALCDFFLFPKIKAIPKGTRFDTVPQVKEKMIELI